MTAAAHGTYARYVYKPGCRCRRCAGAMRRYMAAYRAQRRALGVLRAAGATDADLDRFSLTGGYAVLPAGGGVEWFDTIEAAAVATRGMGSSVVVYLDRVFCPTHELEVQS